MRRFLLTALALWCLNAAADPLVLARDGKSEYAIVHENAASAPEWEREAVRDLSVFLEKMSGAQFPVQHSGAAKNIHVGRIAPGDTRPLAERERRITAVGDDLYIYGDGRWGATFAVYDFLEYFGCRWFSIWGDQFIPDHPVLTWNESGTWSKVPSFVSFDFGAAISEAMPSMRDFARRNRVHLMPPYTGGIPDGSWHIIGPTLHGLSAWLPPGGLPPGKMTGQWNGAYPLLKDKAYFKDHPEYFSLGRDGRRDPRRQLCFSNPELRRELTSNLELVLSSEYDGKSDAVIDVGANDTGGPFCCCSDCRRLELKYSSPGGPYFDYLVELGKIFETKYPRLTLRFLCYLATLSEKAPSGMKMGRNLAPMFAPLHADFMKPLDHPHSAPEMKNLQDWSRVAPRIWIFMYPNPYEFSAWSHPLTAGVHRIAQDMRIFKKNNVAMITAETGGRLDTNVAFKELQLYAMAHLANDLTLDENNLVQEFCRNYYGAAGEKMLAFIAELEKLSAEEPNFMSYQPDMRTPSYITGENLLRWERLFDEMEALVANDARRLLNVRRARLNLDLTVVQAFPKVRHLLADPEGELRKISQRHQMALADDLKDVFSKPVNPKRAEKLREEFFKFRLQRGLEQFLRVARGGAELPEEFQKPGVYQLIPEHIKQIPHPDPDGAFGISAPIRPVAGKLSLLLRDRRMRVALDDSRDLIAPWKLDALDRDRFRLYHLGKSQLTPDSLLRLSAPSWRVEFFTGYLFDPKHPEQEYDFYLSLKYDDENKRLLTDQLVLVKNETTSSSAPIIAETPPPSPPVESSPKLERGALYVLLGNSGQRIKVERKLPASLRVFPPQKNGDGSIVTFLHTFCGGGMFPEFGEIELTLLCEGDGTMELAAEGYTVPDPAVRKTAPLWMEVLDFSLNGKSLLKRNQTYSRKLFIPGSKIKVKSGDRIQVKAVLSRPTTKECARLDASRLRKQKKK